MLLTISELIAEWRQRLSACRDALRAAGEDHTTTQYLRMHERILRYLLVRYEPAPAAPPPLPPPLPRRRKWQPPPLPEMRPSDLYPPRGRAELGVRLQVIHQALTDEPRRRPWLLRRRPKNHRRL